ncbi:hypothetical protein [Pseudonocardia sp. GCM10023141]|uniref:hypothetical protein n=1 Tax=Pseudonocardia sp. GCM10023141 TaxID=3252653 RepID=UPI0036190216
MAKIIRLLCDWGLYPFYFDNGDGLFDLIDPDDFQQMFGLPEHVMRELLDWDKLYESTLNWDDPLSSGWATPEDEEHYLECGRRAAKVLRQHIPADVSIMYVAEGNSPVEFF